MKGIHFGFSLVILMLVVYSVGAAYPSLYNAVKSKVSG